MTMPQPDSRIMTDLASSETCISTGPTALQTDTRDILDRAERILCDLDGCLIQAGRAIPGAAQLVARYREKFRILSNNSTDTPQSLADKLNGYGIEISPEQIILAGAATVEFIAKNHPACRVMAIASDAICELANQLGLGLVSALDPRARPDLILICRDTDLHYDKLQTVIRWVAQGVPYMVANPDMTHPGEGGWPVMETGLTMTLIQAATDIQPMKVIGKPENALYLAALDGQDPGNAVMIGDNPLTDIEGAARLGMRSIQVSQEFTVAELI